MAPFRRHLIWIVDDSPLDTERARRALAGTHAIESFPDGSAALERLATGQTPDLVVLDWVMPGISGIDVCKFLRSQRGLPQVAILLLTGQDQTQQIVEGLAAGANDYLAKPYADEELIARVVALLRTKDLLDEVADARRELQALVDTSPDALLWTGPDGRVQHVNPEAERVLGRRADALRGELLESIVPGVRVGLASAPDVRIGERIYSPTVRSPAGSQSCTVSLRDVTEHRRAEARKLDFYSVVAHDLRSPLHAALLRLEVIFKGRRGILAPDLLADLRKMDVSLRSLVSMINDFLDLARLESSASTLERREVDLGAVLHTAVEEFQPLAEANQLSLVTAGTQRGAWTVGDPRRLGQVLSNLLGNAIKFTPASGRVTASIDVQDDFVRTAVSDTGPGIPREALPTLFHRFTRASGTEHVVGSGLGLMIAREIVEAHGGSIGVDSEPGRGSTFWFRLPRAAHRDA